MEPISAAIVTALVAGVTGGVGEVSKKLIVDAYNGLKAALRKKCGADSKVVEAVEKLEKKPESLEQQQTLREEVEAAKVTDDTDLKQLAVALLKKLKDTPEGQATMKKYQIDAEKIGVVGDHTRIEGGMKF